MWGVYCLDGLAPTTGHKHNNYQNTERLAGSEKFLIRCLQTGTSLGLRSHDCYWHRTGPVKKHRTDLTLSKVLYFLS